LQDWLAFLFVLLYKFYMDALIVLKKLVLATLVVIILSSCAPVLREDLMQRGTYKFNLSEIKENPIQYTGKLFILGGIIVKTVLTNEGSLIEAVYVPVDSRGYLNTYGYINGRFLAIYRGREILDPLIYRENREITMAGEFIETRKGTVGEREYIYPLFEIKSIYLWEEYKEPYYYRSPLYPPPYYPYPYYIYPYPCWYW